MRRRKSESKNRSEPAWPVVECHNCGCPNRPDDIRCIYCRSVLSARSGKRTAGAFLTAFLYRLRQSRFPDSVARAVESGLVLFVSAALITAGLYLFYSAITVGGFLTFCLGVLFTLYGGAALLNIFWKKV
jgi:hypothetical protein